MELLINWDKGWRWAITIFFILIIISCEVLFLTYRRTLLDLAYTDCFTLNEKKRKHIRDLWNYFILINIYSETIAIQISIVETKMEYSFNCNVLKLYVKIIRFAYLTQMSWNIFYIEHHQIYRKHSWHSNLINYLNNFYLNWPVSSRGEGAHVNIFFNFWIFSKNIIDF